MASDYLDNFGFWPVLSITTTDPTKITLTEPDKVTPAPQDHLPSSTIMPPETLPLREELDALLNDLLPADKVDEIKGNIIDAINLKVNIPVIGEAVERVLIAFLFKMVLTVAKRYGQGVIDKVVDAVEDFLNG